MKQTLFLIIVLFTINSYGQVFHNFKDSTWSWHTDLNLGVTSIGGYSITTGYGISKRLNNIELSAGFDSQVGKVTTGFITPELYNDKFYHVDLLYGRILQYKRLVSSLNLGVNYYSFIDKEVYFESNGYFGSNQTVTSVYKGIGLVVRPSLHLVIGRKNLLGLEGNLHYNSDIIIGNLGLNWKILF